MSCGPSGDHVADAWADPRNFPNQTAAAARFQQHRDRPACVGIDGSTKRLPDAGTGGKRGMRRASLAILFFVALVAIWAALVHAEIWSPVLLPSPRNVFDYLVNA